MLTKLSDEDGVGANLEYDEAYMQMEELAVPVPASEVGDSVNPGRDPDYRALIKNTTALWAKTRDLRVATYFTIAALSLNGLSGMKQGLQLVDYLCTELWDKCYPQLDPDDDNDPTERLNILSMLSPKPGSFNDPIDFIGHFRQLKLCEPVPYRLHDVLVAQGILTSNEEAPDLALVQAQLRGLPEGAVEGQAALLQDVKGLLSQIKQTVNDKIGNAGTADFEQLDREIKNLERFYTSQLSFSGPAVEEDAVTDGTEGSVEGQSQAQPQAAAKAMGSSPRSVLITNRADALLLVKKAADYFRQAEPSSPLPYLLDRVLRMSDMNFMEILAEIDRNNLDKAREQLGVVSEGE